MVVPEATLREFDTLTVFARSTSNADIGNSALVGLPIGVADGDGDGIPDDTDVCPSSNLTPTVVIGGCDSRVANQLQSSGCTFSDRIGEIAAGANNHGQFVSRVAQFTNQLRADGIITGSEKGAIQSCAARAAIP